VAAVLVLLAALLFRPCLWAQGSKDPPPTFSSDSIVNSANGSSASLTPNVVATIYGSSLARSTAQVSLRDIGASQLPTTLAGVRVTIDGLFASLYYVSPTQINFVIPSNLLLGQADLTVIREGVAAPPVQINLLDAAPALFMTGGGMVAATHADGSRVSSDAPARPGETIVVYGTGLGRTIPGQVDGQIPRAAAAMRLLDRLRILLDGQIQPSESIYYAGITPGYPGLYQVNLRLPDPIPKLDPELRIAVDDQISQGALALSAAPADP